LTFDHLAALQELGRRGGRHEAERADHQRDLEEVAARPDDAEAEDEQHRVDVERVEREHAVVRARPAQQAAESERDAEREQQLRGGEHGDQQLGAHSKISSSRRS
jgi:hypothetical protein